MDSAQGFVLLGTGGATPYRHRVNPSVVCHRNGSAILFDCGSGVSQRLSQAHIPIEAIDYVCLSHLHADHCLELPLVILGAFLSGREEPMHIVGPAGTEAFVDHLMHRLFGYIDHLVENVTERPPEYSVVELGGGVFVEAPDFRLSAVPVIHGVPALGYRFDTASMAVAISGDTEPSEDFADFASGADVMVHECPFPPEFGGVPGHTTCRDAGIVAARAAVPRLILTHLFEETVGKEEEMLAEVSVAYSGEVTVGTDLLRSEAFH